jgi:DNA polymerase-3 subunit delta'
MAFTDFPDQKQGVTLLQRSLERGRLGHAYLFAGNHLGELKALACALAKTLNCQKPAKSGPDLHASDSCDHCSACKRIDNESYPDVHWVRPESKSRVITIAQMREAMGEVYLKPSEGRYKVTIIQAADRLNIQAANAFLKTLEEPPERSIFILLTTEPQRILETIISRCLRLSFAGEGLRALDPARLEWLTHFGNLAAENEKSLISRYRLLDELLKKLGAMKEQIETSVTARSPLERHDDIDPSLRDKWEDELVAAIEAEYRLQRSELLVALQWWLRDVWIHTCAISHELLNLPQLKSTASVAKRISAREAVENLRVMEQTQRLLATNVQEALALEVGMLKMHI